MALGFLLATEGNPQTQVDIVAAIRVTIERLRKAAVGREEEEVASLLRYATDTETSLAWLLPQPKPD